MKILLIIALFIPLLIYTSARIYSNIDFERNCEDYLKRAADANTIEYALENLEIAIGYMEEHQMTEGYTSVLYTTPDEDVGWWYNNIMSSYVQLFDMAVNKTATNLEKSNMLMKLRETLLDNTKEGTQVTCPPGISIYPRNVNYAMFGSFAFALALFGLGIILKGVIYDY